MAFNLINPVARLGEPFQQVTPSGNGLLFVNRSGATISRGQIAAINLASTNSGFADLISTGANATAGKWPLVLALADVGDGVASDKFHPMVGGCNAIITNAIVKGAMLMPGTTSATGGNILIAASTASGAFPVVAFAAATGDGATPTAVVGTRGFAISGTTSNAIA